MSSYEVIHNYFPNGDLSPLWKGRSNTEFYNQGLAKCHNFMPLITGGLRRRPGSYYIDTLKGAKVALFPINYKDTYYVIALTNNHISIYNTNTNQRIVNDDIGTTGAWSEVNFPDVDKISYANNDNKLYLVADDHRVVKITVSSSGSFSCDTPNFFTSEKDTSTTPVSIKKKYIFNSDPDPDPLKHDSNENPSCVGFKDGRLILGATNNNPNRIWISRTASADDTSATEYTDFYIFSGFDSGGAVVVNTNDGIMAEDNDLTCARWFLSHNRLLVGAPKAILMSSSSSITPYSFDLSKTSTEGSANLDAKEVNGYILYATSDTKKLMMMIWDNDSQSYSTTCVSSASDHLFTDGIEDFTMAFMPEPVIWVITKKGVLLSGTVSTGDGLNVGWAVHKPVNGREYCNILGVKRYDNADRLYIVTKNTAYGVSKFMFEYIDMDDILHKGEYNYIDCAQKVENTNLVIVDECFLGQKFSIMATTDAENSKLSVLPDKTVTRDGANNVIVPIEPRKDGQIYSKIWVGLPINSLAGFVSSELPTNGQSSFGNKRRISKVKIRIYNSYGGNVGVTDSCDDEMITRKYGRESFGKAIELTEGDIDTFVSSKNKTDGEVYVIANSPTPLNILAAKIKYELLEG